MRGLQTIPFGLALGLLAAGTLIGVLGLSVLGFGVAALLVIPVAVALGLVYLWSYAQRPQARPVESEPATAVAVPSPATPEVLDDPDEPFEDPVELADRADQAAAAAAAAPDAVTGPAAPPPPSPDEGDDGLE
jgi:predicted lipid-binding transport protein (Tim44 family)